MNPASSVHSIPRRNFLATLGGVGALTLLARGAVAADEPAAPAPARRKGRIKQGVCTGVFRGLKLTDDEMCREVVRLGGHGIDLQPPEKFAVLKKHGLTCAMVTFPTGKTPQGVTVGTIPKSFNRLEHHDTLVEIYTKRIEEVADAGLTNLICFSGNREKLDDQQGIEHCAIGLKRLMPLAEKRKVTLCMELLNSKVNHKDYQCDHTAWGVELVKRVGSERFKLLYDIYHMQIMEGDLIRTLKENARYIGHYHTGGNPGRNEIDDSQELNYPAIMRAIADTGFKGYVAHEFTPTRDPLQSLTDAVRICDV
jgi:hydroxypyruvate isomerase